MLAYEIFKRSMLKEANCQIVGYSCPSWKKFTNGLCGECTNEFPCRHIGISDHKGISEYYQNISKNEIINPYPLFVKLKSRNDYCLMHYQLIIQTATSAEEAKGKLLIRIERSSKILHTEEMEENFMPGKNYTRLIVRDPDDGDLIDIKINISWITNNYKQKPIIINIIQFRFMSHTDPK
jgi:hypothetical protein